MSDEVVIQPSRRNVARGHIRVTFQTDLEPPAGSDAEYAQRLLEHITAVPTGSLRRFATEEDTGALAPAIHALKALGQTRANGTTLQEDHSYALVLLELLDQFADRVSSDLGRRVAVEFATTLLPRFTDQKETAHER